MTSHSGVPQDFWARYRPPAAEPPFAALDEPARSAMVHRAVIDASALLDDACRGNIPAAEAAWGAWIILCRAANIILAAPVGGWPGDEVAA